MKFKQINNTLGSYHKKVASFYTNIEILFQNFDKTSIEYFYR